MKANLSFFIISLEGTNFYAKRPKVTSVCMPSRSKTN